MQKYPLGSPGNPDFVYEKTPRSPTPFDALETARKNAIEAFDRLDNLAIRLAGPVSVDPEMPGAAPAVTGFFRHIETDARALNVRASSAHEAISRIEALLP